MLLAIAIALTLKRYGTHTAPLPAHTLARDDSSEWYLSRTALHILWSCLATTFACTWVSIHPNVPFRGEGKWTLLRRRIFLMFFSILAPEFMIIWAFKQWRGAVMIREAVNAASPESDKSWTTTHGHFLQMGGFQLHITARENLFQKQSTSLRMRNNHPFPRFFLCRPEHVYEIHRKIYDRIEEVTGNRWILVLSEDKASRIDFGDDIIEGVLKFETLKQLLTENLIDFPTITEDEIRDRSKGDALSKGIALLQLIWFAAQIIARVTQGLAITELELTTAALAGLNSVMYIFWWSKPCDVRFPLVIRTKGVMELQTKACRNATSRWEFLDLSWNAGSRFDFRGYLWSSTNMSIRGMLSTLFRFFALFPKRVENAVSRFSDNVNAFPRNISWTFSHVRRYIMGPIGTAKGREISEHNCFSCEGSHDGPEKEGQQLIYLGNSDEEYPARLDLSDQYYANLERKFPAIINGAKTTMKVAALPIIALLYLIDSAFYVPVLVILECGAINAPLSSIFGSSYDEKIKPDIYTMIFFSEDAGVRSLLCASSIAGTLIGAVHCLAWNFTFSSYAEQMMWRTASFAVVGSRAATLFTTLVIEDDAHQNSFWYIVSWIGSVLFGFATILYPISRVILFVLAVTSLRSLPQSAFDTVNWIDLVPHI